MGKKRNPQAAFRKVLDLRVALEMVHPSQDTHGSKKRDREDTEAVSNRPRSALAVSRIHSRAAAADSKRLVIYPGTSTRLAKERSATSSFTAGTMYGHRRRLEKPNSVVRSSLISYGFLAIILTSPMNSPVAVAKEVEAEADLMVVDRLVNLALESRKVIPRLLLVAQDHKDDMTHVDKSSSSLPLVRLAHV